MKMPDLFDAASALEQHSLEVALTHRKPTLKDIGRCHWCDEPVQPGAHFCDPDCRDDYQKSQHMSGRIVG